MTHGAPRTRTLFAAAMVFMGLLLFMMRPVNAYEPPASAPPGDQPNAAPVAGVTLKPHGLSGASDGSNFWYLKPVSPFDPDGYSVMHHGFALDAGQANVAFSMQEWPSAMVAADGQVYLIFDPQPAAKPGETPPETKANTPGSSDSANASHAQRIVTRVRAEYVEETRLWKYQPKGHMERVASLPGEGRVVDAVSDGHFPLVLLETTSGGIPRDRDGAGNRAYSLMSFGSAGWSAIPLPDAVEPGSGVTVRLIAAQRPTIIVGPANQTESASGNEKPRFVVYERLHDAWVGTPTEVDPARIESSCLLDDVTALAVTDAQDAKSVLVGFLRDGSFLPVSTLSKRMTLRRLVAVDHRLGLAEQKSLNDPVTLSLIDYTTGLVSDGVEMQQFVPIREDDFGLLILVAGLLVSLLILAVFRPNPAKMKPELPATMAITSPTNRLVALMIDYVPAAALASQILNVPLSSTLTPPVMFIGWSNSGPAMLAIGLCLAHCTFTECLWGRTLGKFFTDCRTVTLQGKKPSIVQTLVRNVMKGMALMLPPLAALVFMNPYRQHLGDLVARTLVASDLGRNDPTQQQDR